MRIFISFFLLLSSASAHAYNDLYQAACGGDLQKVMDLLRNPGANPNNDSDLNSTPLIKAGANVNHRNKYGNSALYEVAGLNGTLDIINFLISHGAEINIRTNKGETPLMYAAKHGVIENMNLLYQLGSNLNLQNKDGATALILAGETSRNLQVISQLLTWGANPNIQGNEGKTILFHQILYQSNLTSDLIRELGRYGYNFELKNKEGDTILFDLLSRIFSPWSDSKDKYIEFLKVLIEKKVNVNAKNSNDATPLAVVNEYKNSSHFSIVAGILIAAGASP